MYMLNYFKQRTLNHILWKTGDSLPENVVESPLGILLIKVEVPSQGWRKVFGIGQAKYYGARNLLGVL